MKGLIALRRLRVENANAVSGMTWGFPSVSQFLGYCHALDRKLCAGTRHDTVLGGCVIVSHDHQTHSATDDYGEHGFALSRNPLTKEGKTAPFNEEGRMHLTVTLLIECALYAADIRDGVDHDPDPEIEDDSAWLAAQLERTVQSQRLAGGTLTALARVEHLDLPQAEDKRALLAKKTLRQCLPGFALVDRSELMLEHLKNLQEQLPDAELLDAWMDFGGLRYRAEHSDAGRSADWQRAPLPETGWFVPLMVGYQGIAPLQAAGSVPSARDPELPFAAVESIYGVGQWISPHRLSCIEALLWRYAHEQPQHYRFSNQYTPAQHTEEGS